MREIIDWICKEFGYDLSYYLTVASSYERTAEINKYNLLCNIQKEFGEKKYNEIKPKIEKLITWLDENIVYYASWDCDFDGNVEYDSIIWNNYSQFEEDIEKFKELL